WMSKVNGVLKQHGGIRKNGKVASDRTQTATKEVIYAAMRVLHKMGYKLQDPKNLSERHIEALVRQWWFEDKKTPKTLEEYLSRLRRFCEMMGKVGMVKRAKDYLPDVPVNELVVSAVAKESKSWASKNLDMTTIWPKIDARDKRLGAILRIELAFGIRREEALKCRPHTQGYISHYAVLPGQGKGGRYRNVITMTQAQRDILDYVKSVIPRGESLGWPLTRSGKIATLKQNLKRYDNEMAALGFTKNGLGVTGHGLRAQFAENNALAHGIIPPTMGGTTTQYEKKEMKVRLGKLSEAMGHGRDRVMASYYSAFSRKTTPDDANRSVVNIQKCLPLLPDVDLLNIPAQHKEDCYYIQRLMGEFDLDMTVRQVHVLWIRHSRRNGVEWMKPEHEIALGLESQAIELAEKKIKLCEKT
ncbi:MAG: integrase domain-containing protein, partial [Burkholderiaceae bacterium]|nr:integrase domain-containing protein [Burkholderiaceae bacterium]